MCLIVVGWRVHRITRWLSRPIGMNSMPGQPQHFRAGQTHRRSLADGILKRVEHGWGSAKQGDLPPSPMSANPAWRPANSRGALTRQFLCSPLSAVDYASTIDGAAYSGFNLLISDDQTLVYFSNRDGQARTLAPGIYGLSNHQLDTPWPKLLAARTNFSNALTMLPDESAFSTYWAMRPLSLTRACQAPAFRSNGNDCYRPSS
jgi:hypothetical protein